MSWKRKQIPFHLQTEIVRNNKRKFVPFKGFESIDALVETCLKKGIEKSRYYILEVNAQYYAVCFQSWYKQVVIAKDHGYFRTNDGRFTKQKIEEFVLPYEIKERAKLHSRIILAKEFLQEFPDTNIYGFRNKLAPTPIKTEDPMDRHNYIIILAALFFNQFFSFEMFNQMKKYFSNSYSYKQLFSGKVVAINPFSQTALYTTGEYVPFYYRGNGRGYYVERGI